MAARNRTEKGTVKALSKDAVKEINDVARLEIVRMPISDLQPHPKNPRKHPDQGSPQWEALATSLKHDYFSPLVWNRRNGMLVSGHLRRKVLLSQGVNYVDVAVVDYDEKTHIARMLAANKGAGKDDRKSSIDLLVELVDAGIDAGMAGYDLSELDKWLAKADQGNEVTREPDYPIMPKLGEKHDYVIVYTDNESDRAFLHSLLGVRKEQSYKATAIGTGRVVHFARALENLVANIESLKAQKSTTAEKPDAKPTTRKRK